MKIGRLPFVGVWRGMYPKKICLFASQKFFGFSFLSVFLRPLFLRCYIICSSNCTRIIVSNDETDGKWRERRIPPRQSLQSRTKIPCVHVQRNVCALFRRRSQRGAHHSYFFTHISHSTSTSTRFVPCLYALLMPALYYTVYCTVQYYILF